MATDPWAEFSPQTVQGGPIMGPPPKPPAPQGPPSGFRPSGEGLEIIPGGPADPYRPGGEYDPNKPATAEDSKITESERTAAFLATRVGGGMKDIQTALKTNQSANTPQIGASLAGELPLVGNVARNWLNSPERQRVEAAQIDVLDAALTLGTGAAYSKEQLAGYQQAYFPQIGDDKTTIADKRQRLRRLFESAKLKAGRSSPLIDEALASLDVMSTEGPPASDTEQVEGIDLEGRPAIWPSWDAVPPGASVRNPDGSLSLYGGEIRGGQEFNPEDRQRLEQRIQQDNNVLDAGAAGAVDAISVGLDDEIGAVVPTISDLISGRGSLADLYSRNLRIDREAKERLSDLQKLPYLTGQVVGGAAVPMGTSARGIGGLAKLGAAQGGAYGFGSSEGNPLQRIPGTVTGAAIGGAAGGTLGALSGLVRNRGGAATEVIDNLPVIQAGERQGIPIRQPDARPSVRGDFAGVEASQTGNPIVTRTLNADKDAVATRLSEVGGQGRVLDDYELGQSLQSTGEKYLARTRGEANALYRRAEQAGGTAQGEATEALQAIEREIAELTETGANTNAGAIKYLNDLKADLQGGASIAKLRNIRSNVRGQINERNLTSTDTERRVGNVLNSLSEDVNRILPMEARGPFATADKFYRQRMEFKDQVIRRFVGAKNDPISPETAASRFMSFMKSKDYGRFSRMMDEMAPDEKADIAATVAEHLGTGRNGEFSLAALSTNVDNMSDKALEKVFGSDGAAALKDLKIIARAKADTAGALNTSRTGVVNQRMGLKDAVLAAAGGTLGGLPGAIGGLAFRSVSEKIGNRRLANALLNPNFTKWLKNVPDNPAAAKPYIRSLTSVVAKSGTAAADIKAIQSALMEAFAQSPGRAAAEQENNGGEVPPKQQ